MKNKMLKAFTLIELIVVMAIFVMIMGGALMLVQPVRSLFKDTSDYVGTNSAVDNMSNYLENVFINANRVHIYVGWDELEEIGKLPGTASIDPDFVKNNWTIPEEYTKTWGSPNVTNSNPLNFFSNSFYLLPNTELIYNIKGNAGVNSKLLSWIKTQPSYTSAISATGDWTHTMKINRPALDTSLSSENLDVYVLEIKHNADGTIMKPGDDSADPNLGGIRLSTYKPDGDINAHEPINAINPAYYKDLDYKLIFGEVLTDADGDSLAAVDFTSTTGYDETKNIFQFRGQDASKEEEGTFFDESRFSITLLAKPIEETEFSTSSLLYTSAVNPKNSLGKEEKVFFNVTESKLTFNGAYIKDNTLDGTTLTALSPAPPEIDPITGTSFIEPENDPEDPNPIKGPFSYANFPLRYEHKDVKDGNYDIYIHKNYVERKTADIYNTGDPMYGLLPIEVAKWKIFYNSDNASAASKSLKFASEENIFIVFTLPKEYVKS